MPKILRARAPQDEKEERWVRRLAGSRHGPADWILHARIVVRSWDGQRVETIAQELHCSPQTVRRRLHRFEAEGVEGLGDRPKSGRPRRVTAEDDSRLIALARQAPPGRLVTGRDGTMVAREEEAEAQWSLNALARAAEASGHPGQTQSGPSHSLTRKGALAQHPQLERAARQRLCPKRTAVVTHYTAPASGVDDHLQRRTGTGSATHL
jgi:transposase